MLVFKIHIFLEKICKKIQKIIFFLKKCKKTFLQNKFAKTFFVEKSFSEKISINIG